MPNESADVVYGEPMLTMQAASQKQAIAEELRTPTARKRIVEMRRVLRRYEEHLCAVTMVGRKA